MPTTEKKGSPLRQRTLDAFFSISQKKTKLKSNKDFFSKTKRRRLNDEENINENEASWNEEKKNDEEDAWMDIEQEETEENTGQKYPIGTTFLKDFHGEDFEGTIVGYDPEAKYYDIKYYADGDEEDMTESEVAALIKETVVKKAKSSSKSNKKKSSSSSAKESKKEKQKPKKVTPTASDKEEKPPKQVQSRLRVRRKVSYDTDQDYPDEMFEESDEEQVVNKTKKSLAKKKKQRRIIESSDEEFSSEESPSSSEDERDDFDDESEEEEVKKPAAKKRKASSEKKTGESEEPAQKEKKKMCDAFTPMNTPPYMKESLDEIFRNHEFLDPCGMEATDDIIDRLVGEQVDKIGSLLQRALKDKKSIASVLNPLKLGTACSGTDAPALALTLVQEQMELRGLDGLFNFTHEFSCENDPFKQAYLARNFDSVLYPDIARLTDEEPRDVYGQVKHIPPFNLFVAGTSCKNFSMLRSNKRIDIEDKGCSGETFLAATELLFKDKPELAIFENVIGAPWAKMQEYITGRVKLSECDSSKAIKDIKDKKKELTFVLDEDDNIVVDHVPSVYGVRCGAVVSGYLKPGSTKLRDIEWPKTKTSCTLTELMKNNNISKADDTLVFETECTYCTHIIKVDTKEYGLPQTRLRTYMFVWRPDDDNVNDDLGEFWEALVKHLQSPVRHSLQAFILQVDHDIIRVFREALNGPAGRQTQRGVFLEPDFWTSANANLPHNKVAREKLGISDTTRFITNWGGFGKKQIPPHYWLEYLKCNDQRIMDVLDILHASAARDAETHDSNFASFYWNVSQNASKEKHRSATPGVAGCISPGGDFFVPNEGRPLLGCEKLLIQGIPYFRLLLGNETEVQLGDLAGNAMSLTVVCATMLAAITCKELRKETLKSSHGNMQKTLRDCAALKSCKKKSVWEGAIKDPTSDDISPSLPFSSAMSVFEDLALLAPDAVKSSIWCTCETSGSTSLTRDFLECTVCRVSCCRNCICTTAGYNMHSHETVDVDISAEDHSLGTFQSKLRNLVPPSLFFNDEGVAELAGIDKDSFRVSGLSSYMFNLHRIKRDRKKWLIIYYARDNNGIGEAIAEFRISVGEIKRDTKLDSNPPALGMTGELTSFLPARTKPLVYGSLEPCLCVTIKHGDNVFGDWIAKCGDSKSSLILEGYGSTDSPRVEVGLTDAAASAVSEATSKSHNAKWYGSAKDRGEIRRWKYPKNWKVWPERIEIKADRAKTSSSVANLCGTYERARCRQTTNQSALWIRTSTIDEPPLYILIKPNVNRTGPDAAIVSSSMSHEDASSILAVLPRDWQPSDSLIPANHVVDVTLKNWRAVPNVECRVPESSIVVSSPTTPNVLVSASGLSDTDMAMLCRGVESDETIVRLDVTSGQKAQQTVRAFNCICVAPILKHAAGTGLKYDLNPVASWIDLTHDPVAPFGCCRATIPPRPTEEWFFDDERKSWERRSEPGASRKYYLALQEAPQPFELWMNKKNATLTVKCFPEVVAHHATAQLLEGRECKDRPKDVSVSYRLSDVAHQSDPVIAPFKVSNCDSEQPTDVSLRGEHRLYERQQKVVTKMLSIENMNAEFSELEMSEHEMPGSTGLSLIAKATTNTKLRGGVIADAIGAGKTVISIALILHGLEKARASRKFPNKSGATLVVVPPALINQWESEIRKFSTTLKVVRVYDDKSLAKRKVKDIIEADVVICPIDILEASGYVDRVVKTAKLGKNIAEIPKLPSHTGQIEQNNARGVWIPATSADPYAGANNHRNQERRNQSAYYTYVYLMAIQKLREREFSSKDMGVPLEYYEFERVIVDEIHESLCTTRVELDLAKEKDKATSKTGKISSGFFKERNRRAGRELLGITQKDIRRRPLLFRKGIFGLTGTPLLDSSSRVIELGNLMGGAYVIGLSSHWRKLERESCRDIFLHNYLEPKQSREIRKNIYAKCQDYLHVACCRNKTGEEMEGIELINHERVVRMTKEEKTLYLDSQSGIIPSKRSFAIKPEDFDVTSGHDISKFLRQNASFESRGKELVSICREILSRKGDEHTKIIVFTDGRIEAGDVARDFLCADDSGIGCTSLDGNDSVAEKNKKISWYQNGDATEEDRSRPRVLVLHFEHAAGLNLQTECHDLILFTPLYVGEGGSSSDPVSDASTELQAIGRVYRPGQTNPHVNVYRIEVRGPDGEECLDGQLIRRNTDEETVAMATNAGE